MRNERVADEISSFVGPGSRPRQAEWRTRISAAEPDGRGTEGSTNAVLLPGRLDEAGLEAANGGPSRTSISRIGVSKTPAVKDEDKQD